MNAIKIETEPENNNSTQYLAINSAKIKSTFIFLVCYSL